MGQPQTCIFDYTVTHTSNASHIVLCCGEEIKQPFILGRPGDHDLHTKAQKTVKELSPGPGHCHTVLQPLGHVFAGASQEQQDE